MKSSYQPISPVFMYAFIGFFVTPVIVGIYLIFFSPGEVNYATGGPILLFSVLIGAFVGAFLGWVNEIFKSEPMMEEVEIIWGEEFRDPEFDI